MHLILSLINNEIEAMSSTNLKHFKPELVNRD